MVFVCVTCIVFCTIESFFFFNDTPTTEIYTLSLHDALPIYLFLGLSGSQLRHPRVQIAVGRRGRDGLIPPQVLVVRSEEHTSELQSHSDLVCRLLLEKKKRL